MNSSSGKGSMSTASSSAAWKAGDVVPDQFPAGLRVLLVDDDPTCLMILEKMLRTCFYEGTIHKFLALWSYFFLGFSLVLRFDYYQDMIFVFALSILWHLIYELSVIISWFFFSCLC